MLFAFSLPCTYMKHFMYTFHSIARGSNFLVTSHNQLLRYNQQYTFNYVHAGTFSHVAEIRIESLDG
jgi:cbb3-type cytochrome oxidase subunit 1